MFYCPCKSSNHTHTTHPQQAACLTVDIKLKPHSLHCYFIAPTNAEKGIKFEVCSTRDGRSFCSRTVRAVQGDSTLMLLLASFHDATREARHSHQISPPPALHPSQLPSDEQRLLGIMGDTRLPEAYKGVLQGHLRHLGPIDVRHARDSDPIMPQPECPSQLVYFKPKLAGSSVEAAAAAAARGLPELLQQRAVACSHYVAAAFASDHMILATAALPHTWPNPSISMMASLDHSMWFHGTPDCDAWATYELRSERLGFGRGLSFGKVYLQDGTHAISTSQEGLIRFASAAEPHDKHLFPQSALWDFDREGQPVQRKPLGSATRQVIVLTSDVWGPSDSIARPRLSADASAKL